MKDNEKIELFCDDVKKLLLGDRQKEYGCPRDSFTRIALFWNAYLWSKFKGVIPDEHLVKLSFSTVDVALLMSVLKVARAITADDLDSTKDLAGYALLASLLKTEKE